MLVLVLAKNMMDSKNVTKLGTSFATVYEDRLLVESYIYQLSGHLYQKKMMIEAGFHAQDFSVLPEKLKQNNAAISGLLVEYGKTQLTKEEAVYFRSFKHNLAKLRGLESQLMLLSANGQETVQIKSLLDKQYEGASEHLNRLSHIQVAEGKRLNEQSKQIIAGSAILTQFELILVIAIGVMIQMLVFASKSKLSKFPQNPMLN
ncbi:hypothetical protein DC20_05295 [Rufibacter tibetensis]|uniref:Chemotaxis methyl-accepting receptor HlyB-like 4HB MCP domain-containing protein n=1 Tax=Rufibacter tibetensis TaxID=512763 RepID=A0A0P0C5H2_9BACT|nr:hypothetical protein DC20_05295 [Rufibacter tibetensis]